MRLASGGLELLDAADEKLHCIERVRWLQLCMQVGGRRRKAPRWPGTTSRTGKPLPASRRLPSRRVANSRPSMATLVRRPGISLAWPSMKSAGGSTPPPRLVLWWESLETWVQLAISFPIFVVLTFLINTGPFNQPLVRSVLYGLFEGAVLSGLMAVATATERGRRPH